MKVEKRPVLISIVGWLYSLYFGFKTAQACYALATHHPKYTFLEWSAFLTVFVLMFSSGVALLNLNRAVIWFLMAGLIGHIALPYIAGDGFKNLISGIFKILVFFFIPFVLVYLNWAKFKSFGANDTMEAN